MIEIRRLITSRHALRMRPVVSATAHRFYTPNFQSKPLALCPLAISFTSPAARQFTTTSALRNAQEVEKIEPDHIHSPDSLIVEIDSMAKFQEHVNPSSPAIIIDFYADWCGPCKKLTPMLEQLATQFKGRFKLLKVNVDNVQDVASQFSIEVLPTLYGVIGGKQIAAVETGLHPEAHLKEWIKAIISAHDKYVVEIRGTVQSHTGVDGENLEDIDTSGMTPHERLDLAARLMAGGKHEAAGKIYNNVIEDDTAEMEHPKAYAGLLMCLIGKSQFDDCFTLVGILKDRFPVHMRTDPDLMRSLALLDISKEFAELKGDSAAEVESLLAKEIEKHPEDVALLHKRAIVLFMAGRQDAAVSEALNILKKNKSDQKTKDLLIKFFNILGAQSKITVDGRRKMASYLF